MAKLKGKIEKKIFVSPESGFGVFKFSLKSRKKGNIIITGNLIDVREGDFLEIEGQEINHPRFGPQINVKTFTSILPQDSEGITRYLVTRDIKGLGPKTAEKIVKNFGLSTFIVLEKNPEELAKVSGINKKVISEIKKSFSQNRVLRELTIKLSPYGIKINAINKMYAEFKDGIFGILESNPYQLINSIEGISFRTADQIANAYGISSNHSQRLVAGIAFILRQNEQKNGDLYMVEKDLLVKSSQLLNVFEINLQPSLEKMIIDHQLIREINSLNQSVILEYRIYQLEKSISQHLWRLSSTSHSQFDPDMTKEFLARISCYLTPEQLKAVAAASENSVLIITGGPGTGKTTIIKAIVELFINLGLKVLIAAPTGKASKRIEEATNYSASTIHRLLKMNPELKRFVYNEGNPLPTDVLIVDESSMIDSYLFFYLIKALSISTRFILIGDQDQLPPVGPGNVFSDLISSKQFPTFTLSRNFRQHDSSLIIDNAYRINKGVSPLFKPYGENLDFVYIKVDDEANAFSKAVNIFNYYQQQFAYNSSDWQILAPMYRGLAGIDNLNRTIQERFNPHPFIMEKDKMGFKRDDKVMQLVNNYEKEVFNGDQGIVLDLDSINGNILIKFSHSVVAYSPEEFDQLTLAYAISVHKAQGSEYEWVILILLPSHSILLNRKLFYTAITRAKKRFFLISNRKAIDQAIINISSMERKTLLPIRLKEMFASQI